MDLFDDFELGFESDELAILAEIDGAEEREALLAGYRRSWEFTEGEGWEE
jgi:hypothetical protein